jgi:gamma-glutamylputrescine oxidase
MNSPYWHLEKWSQPNTTQTNFDVAIVGAGIAGLSIAYWLEKKDPNLSIVIIDKSFIGAGASGRNGGFVTCGSAEHFDKLTNQFGLRRAHEIWKFSEQNRELLLEEIIQDDFSACDFKQSGSCTVAPNSESWDRYQGIFSRMRSCNIDVELILEESLLADYGVKNFLGGIQYNLDGYIHPMKLLKKISEKLRRTSFYLNTNISQIDDAPDSISIKIPGRCFSVAHIFYGLNGFAPQLLPELSKWIKPQRGQALITEPLPHFVRGPCYLTKHLCYFRQLPTGELLVGGFRNLDLDTENTDIEITTDIIQNALTDFTQSYFNNTEHVKIQHRWSGIMGFAPDNQMLLGKLPHRNNSYFMAGCASHGMGLSFNAAKVLVGSAYGESIPPHLRASRYPI